jgi:hypothetical protein
VREHERAKLIGDGHHLKNAVAAEESGIAAGAATGAGASSFLPQAASDTTIREAISSDLVMMIP